MSYRDAVNQINNLGYQTVQEAIADCLILGEGNKTQGTWVEATDVSDIRTDRVIMNKAQAKYYGLEIVDSHEQDDTEGEQPQQV